MYLYLSGRDFEGEKKGTVVNTGTYGMSCLASRSKVEMFYFIIVLHNQHKTHEDSKDTKIQ